MAVSACVHLDSVLFLLRIRHKAVYYGMKQSMTQLNVALSGVTPQHNTAPCSPTSMAGYNTSSTQY